METDTQQVISNLRACLLSIKGGIPIQSLDRDYRVLVGSSIPYRKLGFDSLEKFLKSIPDVSISRSRTGEVILDAIPSKNTKHLTDLIARQKSAPRRLKPSRSSRSVASHWKPPATSVRRNYSDTSYRSRRTPLSVTVSTSTRDRTVKVAHESRSTSYSSGSGRGASQSTRPSQHSFEVPPRFLKLSSSDLASNTTSVRSMDRDSPVISPQSVVSPATSEKSQSQHSSVSTSSTETCRLSSPLVAVGSEIGRTHTSAAPQVSNGSISGGSVLQLRSRMRGQREVPRVIPVADRELEVMASQQSNYRTELQRIARVLGLGEPTFSVVPRFPNGGTKAIYGCIVKVGEHSYNSYPDEHVIPGEAAQIVAQIAVENLTKLYEGPLGLQQLPETTDVSAMMKRVTKIVMQFQNGVWSTQIPIEYKEKYLELLPADWVKQMMNCPFVTLEYVPNGRYIISPNEASGDIAAYISPPAKIEPETLIFPSSDQWDVYVTFATSTAEVWMRLIGDDYNVLYESMSLDMEMLYTEVELKTAAPAVGCLYALEIDGCWHRVRLESITEQESLVFFIDHGDSEIVGLDRLQVLEPQFVKLPAQAVQCCLSGLEDFIADQNASKYLIDIVGKILVADVASRGTDEDPTIRVVLYDTSSEDDINLNQMLVEKMSQEVNAPRLPQIGEIVEVHISHITDSGEVYIQIDSDSYNYLETLVKQVTETAFTPDNLKHARSQPSSASKLYLGKYPADNRYYRAEIVEVLSSKEVRVFFVDYGNTEIIPFSDLLLLEVLSKTLEEFPIQATRVILNNVPPECFTPKLVARVHELLPVNEPVLMKMIELVEPRLPVVELFKRIADSNELVSINNTLLVDPSFKKSITRSLSGGDSVTRSKLGSERLRSVGSSSDRSTMSPSPSRLSPQFSGSDHGDQVPLRGLPAPLIPDIQSYFDVHVTMAANPSNFMVQPYSDRHRLEQLMNAIQGYYSSWPCPIKPPSTVIEGGLYVAMYDDGCFYRVCVSNVIGGNMVSVYFCDYGDVAVLSEDKLQPLADKFKDLPYQAIKAKLSGIRPSHNDWSVEDCLRFQECVVEHVFVSVVMERGPDLLNPSDTCLGLQLIDTTGDKDIKIDQLLVDEGRAVFV